MLHLYAALAEKERRLISERTKAALSAKKAAGADARAIPVNLAEAGYLGRARLVESAADLALRIAPVLRAVRSEGATTLRSIAHALNRRGIKSPAVGLGTVGSRQSLPRLFIGGKFR